MSPIKEVSLSRSRNNKYDEGFMNSIYNEVTT